MVLIDGAIATGEEEETAEERDDMVPIEDVDRNVVEPSESEQFEPDLDDMDVADTEEVIYVDTASAKHEAWLTVDSSSPQKCQHKSTILQSIPHHSLLQSQKIT